MEKKLSLQKRIILILFAVVIPILSLVTIAENKFLEPQLNEEIKQIGVGYGKALASEILRNRLLISESKTQDEKIKDIEAKIQEILYLKANIIRIDVFAKDKDLDDVNHTHGNGLITAKLLASSVEDDDLDKKELTILNDEITYQFKEDKDDNIRYWEISVPIMTSIRAKHNDKNKSTIYGAVRVWVSTKLIDRILITFWKISFAGGVFSVTILILLLSYFLRRAIHNEKLLEKTSNENILLFSQVHDLQRQLANNEKLAVMGQLTANFAHEVGTPLNAVSGHLQLLMDEAQNKNVSSERINIISSQVEKIAQIVRNLLQTTAVPSSQKQLTDVNTLINRTLAIAKPRIDVLKIITSVHTTKDIPLIRVVPIEIEQILLNLTNNAIDSLKQKSELNGNAILNIDVETSCKIIEGERYVEISVYDTGVGIKKENLENVLKPFFTTKKPGEGTGLGLSICKDILQKYNGELLTESKENIWTKITIRIPIKNNV